MKANLRSDVLVPAVGAVVGASFSILGLVLLLRHPSAFWIGVGMALTLGGLLSSLNCYRVAIDNRSSPRISSLPREKLTLREWWNTPKLYPSGDRFSPRESFLYGSISLATASLCLAGAGLAFWLMANASHF